MPGIQPVYDPTNKQINEAGESERQHRVELINTYWAYYRDGGIRRPLKVKPGKPDDNVMLNFSKQGIDRLVSFFAPKPPRFNVPGGSEQKKGANGKLATALSPEQEAVNAFLENNTFDDLITDVGLSGFISGHNFMRLYLPETAPEAMSAANPPRMALLDPRHIIKFWDISDTQRTLFYRLTWDLGDDNHRRQDIVPTWLLAGLTSPNQTRQVANEDGTTADVRYVGWWIIEYEKKKGTTEYTKVGEDSWPYPFAPVVDWKNKHKPHECYGESDLCGADLNDSINFIASNTSRIIKFHAHPKTIGKGVDPGSITATSVDGFYTIPDTADIFNVEMQSDLSSSMTYLDTLRNAYMSQMHVVDLSGIKDKLGQLTSFAVRMLFKDMLDATNAKRMLYGNGLAEVVYRATVMMGLTLEKKPTDEWDDPLPEDRTAEVASLKVEKDMGVVSKQTIQEELGRDPAVEDERMGEEKDDAMEAMVNALTKVNQNGNGGFMNNQPRGFPNGNGQRVPVAK